MTENYRITKINLKKLQDNIRQHNSINKQMVQLNVDL